MELPKRKHIRLKDYDYSQNGAYFITLCVKYRHALLGEIDVGGGFHAAPTVKLSDIGIQVDNTIQYTNTHYRGVEINKYVIMPNHVHLIVLLTGGHGTPPLPNVVGQIKSFTAMKWNEICGTQMQEFWQRSYHDHIIRSEVDYLRIWQYIDENPAKWSEDKYYCEKH